MNKKLLKSFLLLSCTLLLGIGGCTTDYMDGDPQVLTSSDETVGSKTRSLENVVFNDGAQTWMIPQKDPYTLENFQRAYDNLLTGNTAQPLTRSQIASIANTKEPLKATHYRLKIYPKNEDEQWELEKMEDVKIAYIPFDYVQLTTEETKKIEASTRSQAGAYPEINPYTLTYDDLETCDGPADTVSYTLPILYVVWPCDKPLPDDLDYVLECEVFIPPYDSPLTRGSSSTLSVEALQMLENEAISLALGTPVRPVTRATATAERLLKGHIFHWDSKLNTEVGQHNLKQRFQLGSNIWETYTHRDGYFAIRGVIPDEASYNHVFQSSRWRITTEYTTAPIITSYGTVAENWPYTVSEVNMCPANPTVEYTISRAVAHYYFDDHEIPRFNYDDGIRIIAAANPNTEYGGLFFYSKKNRAYITIPNNMRNVANIVIANVFHELGHFAMYGQVGSFNRYHDKHKLIKESFACYVGWYLCENLYRDLGYYCPSEGENYYYLSGQDRQAWTKIVVKNSLYTPLFVDLSDDYNQNLRSKSLNPDNISKVPHSVILKLAMENQNWTSLKNALQSYVGVYYSQTDLNEFIIPYDYWFTHN